ncbi:hypothetical protein QCD85_07055 [Paenibacillus sp. PsM32]|uniref:hypothetical protein n=1 Tax=Paenibacillus sp. PsM32 TaxID=3030536 RepID=UPI00263B0490|nr:hypothetical protein [Paenibacillus sp. PsM32]MDN4617850.1 hypothetical protein [Paenibacillus sp. PsM32]
MKSAIVLTLLATLLGCSSNTTQTEQGVQSNNITEISTTEILARETIRDSPHADLFIFGDRVYVVDQQLTIKNNQIGEKLGTIQHHYKSDESFTEFMSTILTIGTEIYQIKNAVHIDQLAIKGKDYYKVYKALEEG